MKKHVLAAAVVAALCGAGVAQASNIEIYGIIDNYVEAYNNGSNTTARLSSGGAAGSRLGFRGSEDLGNGLSAVFNLEMGLLTDQGKSTPDNPSGSSYLFQRISSIGLKGDFGSVNFGRQYTPTFTALVSMDPTGLALGSALGTFCPPVDRAVNGGQGADGLTRSDNSILYTSPNMGGVIVSGMVGLGERAGSNTDGNYYGASIRYVAGDLNAIVAASAHKASNHKGVANLPYSGNDYQASLSLSYDLKWIKPVAQLAFKKGDDISRQGTNFHSENVFVGALGFSAPVPGGKLIGSVAYAKNDTTDKADAFSAGIRYDYVLSKRTFIYAGAMGVWNEDNADYSLSAGGGSSAGLPTTMGETASTFFVGVNHKF